MEYVQSYLDKGIGYMNYPDSKEFLYFEAEEDYELILFRELNNDEHVLCSFGKKFKSYNSNDIQVDEIPLLSLFDKTGSLVKKFGLNGYFKGDKNFRYSVLAPYDSSIYVGGSKNNSGDYIIKRLMMDNQVFIK